MKKEDILKTIADLNFWGREQNIGMRRQGYIQQIARYAKAQEDIITVIGVRRSGKTTIVKQFLASLFDEGIEKEQTLYINFEDPKFEPFLSTGLLSDIYDAYKSEINPDKKTFLVFDEIQNVLGWEKWVRLMQEKKENVKMILTGSSAKLLTAELATVLTGRTLRTEVFPLSFSEFLLFKKVPIENPYEKITKEKEIQKKLQEYCLFGAFPKIVLEEDTLLKQEMLRELFEGILYRDIVSRYKVKDAHLIRTTAELVVNNFSCPLSANKLRNILIPIVKKKISPNTVVDILEYFENAYLIMQIPYFSYKMKEQKLYPKKIYCIDSGIIRIAALQWSENMGRVYENIVALHLKRKQKEIYYWKDTAGKEVDFLIREKQKITELIQVCYSIEDEQAKKREKESLLKAMSEFKVKTATVITSAFEAHEIVEHKSIRYIPLYKWLL